MAILQQDIYDQRLRALVAPPRWQNPKPADRYNLVVIGGGTAGLVAAAGAAGLGGKVALVERELLGGDCLNYGCVPSKALLRAAKAVAEARRGPEFGLHLPADLRPDFAALMQRMRRLRADIAVHDSAERFQKLGVDVFLGVARFTGRDTVEVDGVRLRFSRALIATGGRPVELDVPGIQETGYRTNLDLFTLTELPRRLVVVGAGPIGCEMAQAFALFGSQVTVITHDRKVLPREDPEASAIVKKAMEASGVRFELDGKLERAERRGRDRIVIWKRGEETHETPCDEILLATGRRPNIENLGLDQAGVQTDQRGVVVDEYLRSSNSRIYASGDVAGKWQFTHAADAMSRLVLRNALFFGRAKVSALTIPWCTYTHPEAAHVGLYQHDANETGLDLEEIRIPFEDVDRAVLDGDAEGFAKAIIDKKTGRLRGATVVAAHAGEILGEACLAVTQRQKVGALSSIIHPYPTQVSVWGRIGDEGMRRKLTPTAAKVLRKILEWRR